MSFKNSFFRILFSFYSRKTFFIPILILLISFNAYSGTKTLEVELNEYLGMDWNRELMSFEIDIGPDVLKDAPIIVNSSCGKSQAQLTNVENWENGWVKSARLFFITDLKSRENKTFRIEHKKNIDNTSPGLLTRVDGDMVQLTTAKFGLRLLKGEKSFRSPRMPSDVSGPVIAMKTAKGEWFGKSAMYGSKRIAGYEAELLEDGPVLARYRIIYYYEDDSKMELTFSLAAGDNKAFWEMHVCRNDLPEAHPREEPVPLTGGWQLYITPGIDPLIMPIKTEHGGNRWGEHGDGLVTVNLSDERAGGLVHLIPWRNWWDQQSKRKLYFEDNAEEPVFFIESSNPGDWIEPAPPGTWLGTFPGNQRNKQQWIGLFKRHDGGIYFQFNDAPGWRKGWFGSKTEGGINHDLDMVKEYVLNWEYGEKHPRLYVSREELEEFRRSWEIDKELIDELSERAHLRIETPSYRDRLSFALYLLTGDKDMALKYEVPDRLQTHLGLLGDFDLMRQAGQVICEYDAIIDSELISEDERPALRSRLAYLGYVLADPKTWSMERGYSSGNLNMSIAHILNLGILAAAIPEHPMSEEWSRSSLAMIDTWLQENIGPDGEFLGAGESVATYAPVSAAKLLTYAIAASNAGFGDYINDHRLKKLMEFLAKQMTPPHPGLDNKAGTPPSGRGPSMQRPGLAGLMSRATRDSDPEYSKIQQWSWERLGYSHHFVNDRLGGLDYVYMNRNLPAEAPDWGMDVFARRGIIMRKGVGTDHEYYVNFLLEPNPQTAWHCETGTLPAVWAKGVPILMRFRGKGYVEREAILLNRVLPARPVEVSNIRERESKFDLSGKAELLDWSTTDRLDFFSARILDKSYRNRQVREELMDLPDWPAVDFKAELPIEWSRKLAMVKDSSAKGANYFLLRDSIYSDQPTTWHMWSKSDSIIQTEELHRRESIISERGGSRSSDTMHLEGDRFTALGQYGVDIHYFVVLPGGTPRQTLRTGISYHIPERHNQYQDLLHLQRNDAGDYYVVIFPEADEESLPEFDAFEDNKTIKVSGDFGTDYVMLTNDIHKFEIKDVMLEGKVAMVQQRGNTVSLNLGTGGRVRFRDVELSSKKTAATLTLDTESKTFELEICPRQDEITKVRLRGTKGWEFLPHEKVSFESKNDDSNGKTLILEQGEDNIRINGRICIP